MALNDWYLSVVSLTPTDCIPRTSLMPRLGLWYLSFHSSKTPREEEKAISSDKDVVEDNVELCSAVYKEQHLSFNIFPTQSQHLTSIYPIQHPSHPPTSTRHPQLRSTSILTPNMKLSTTLAFALTAFTSSVLADNWSCNNGWADGGLRRLSFNFDGYCENRYGQCFLDELRWRGLTVHNWQAWDKGDGWWQVDFSTTAGLAGQANAAIERVTGSWRGCWPNQ